MTLLLDTHFVLWVAIAAHHRLRAAEKQLLSDPSRDIVVSAVSLWELNIKWTRLQRDGDVALSLQPPDVLNFWRSYGVELVSLEATQAVVSPDPPINHPDPFDRLLLVQASARGAKLLTRDAALLGHPQAYAAS